MSGRESDPYGEIKAAAGAVGRGCLVGGAARALVTFLFACSLCGLVGGIVDFVQYGRYVSSGYAADLSPVLVCGMACLILSASTVGSGVALLRRRSRMMGAALSLTASAMAFLVAFLPRPAIGTAYASGRDLFLALGAMAAVATAIIWVLWPQAPEGSSRPG